ncbi:MAG: hypothetical protein ACREL1_03360 [bacterium]
MTRLEKLRLKAKLLVKAKKKNGTSLKLKDALNKIARLSGHSSWRELRRASGEKDLYARATGSFPNYWCKTYEEAKTLHLQQGGFLLPYLGQFFVCQADHVEGLGIPLDDPDLALTGSDWASPKDSKALSRIDDKIVQKWKKTV